MLTPGGCASTRKRSLNYYLDNDGIGIIFSVCRQTGRVTFGWFRRPVQSPNQPILFATLAFQT